MSRVEIYREVIHEDIGLPSHLVRADFAPPPPRLGKWRWRFISNGFVMADSGQGYSRRVDALKGCATVLGAEYVRSGEHPDTFVGWMIRDDTAQVHDLTREAKP